MGVVILVVARGWADGLDICDGTTQNPEADVIILQMIPRV
jgi:hypothetical protein